MVADKHDSEPQLLMTLCLVLVEVKPDPSILGADFNISLMPKPQQHSLPRTAKDGVFAREASTRQPLLCLAYTPSQRRELEHPPVYVESKDSLGSAYRDAEDTPGALWDVHHSMKLGRGRMSFAGRET